MPPKKLVSGFGTPVVGSGNSTPQPDGYADRANIAPIDKPWKNPAFQKKASARNKTAKAVLIAERERTLPLEERIARKKKKAASRGFAADTAEVVAMVESEEAAAARLGPTVTYYSIEAPPSLLPQKRYCDITGLEAPYTDPKSMLRYHNAEVYALLKNFPPATDQAYLSARGAGFRLT